MNRFGLWSLVLRPPMELAVMIEGQNGLNWPRWQRLAAAVEELGFVGLYRSDHYTNANPPDKDSLELWVSLTRLASHTERIEFGPLVSPVSFRQPTMTARMAAAVDDLSGGRLTLGVGAGWQEREHAHYGWQLLDVPSRFKRLEEGLEIITRLLKRDDPVYFQGEYFRVQEAVLLPRPARPGGPPLLVGGNGVHRTLPLVARFADEWNAVFISPEEFARRNLRLDALLIARGRQPTSVRRSLMTGTVFGRDPAEVERKLAARGTTAGQLRQRGVLVGSGPEFIEQVRQFEGVGVQRLMLQWLDLDDLDGLRAMAAAVLPHV